MIGAESPEGSLEQARISSLAVSSSGWFPSDPVPINPGLVAIIGARGSGKTALADLLVAGAGSAQPFDNAASFVRRAGKLIDETVVTAGWTDGGKSSLTLQNGMAGAEDEVSPVRYLSQQFVDRLCAADGVSDRLRNEIERVVFDAWPLDGRLGAASFDELLAYRLQGARSRQEAELQTIAEISGEITTQRLRQQSLPRLRGRLAQLTKGLDQLDKESADLTKKTDKSHASRLALVGSVLDERERELNGLSRRLVALKALKSEIDVRRSSRLPRLLAALREEHSAAGLSESQWADFDLKFVGDVDAIIASGQREACQKRDALAGEDVPEAEIARLDGLDETALATRTVAELRSERGRLQKMVGLDAERTTRLQEIGKRTGRIKTDIKGVEEDIKAGVEADTRIDALTESRLKSYEQYFDALLEEESELNGLYSPLETILSTGAESLSKLSFAVRRHVDLEKWATAGEELLDLRTEGPFRGRGALQRIAADELYPSWVHGVGADAAAAIKEFSKTHSDDLRTHSNVDSRDATSYREWERRVAEWLYRADHVTLNYSLEYDGLDIARLSPGTRGIVLLLLYVAIDQEETMPLIIDQPEENLDPESIYSELVELFRSARTRRQVVMVTHNANLVVNTDVDQVIVAKCGTIEVEALPELTYLAGGLENPAIRSAVCQVLEGGEEAFRERSRRLRISLPRDAGSRL